MKSLLERLVRHVRSFGRRYDPDRQRPGTSTVCLEDPDTVRMGSFGSRDLLFLMEFLDLIPRPVDCLHEEVVPHRLDAVEEPVETRQNGHDRPLAFALALLIAAPLTDLPLLLC